MNNTSRSLEIGTGLFVLLGFAALGFLTTQLPASGVHLASADSYQVTARFDNVGDLKVGAPVTMAGVRIGRVTAVVFDPADFKAVVTLAIERRYNQIPDDSDAAIQTSGLLGAKYVGLGPGGSSTYPGQRHADSGDAVGAGAREPGQQALCGHCRQEGQRCEAIAVGSRAGAAAAWRRSCCSHG